MQAASSLTFTTLLALVPIITIALTIMTAFPVFSDFSNQIRVYVLANLVPDAAGKIIGIYTQQFSNNAAKLTIYGLAFLTVTSIMLMLTIDRSFNTIWRVSRPRPLLHRLVTYWAVLTTGPILIGASLSLTSWLLGQTTELTRQIPTISLVLLKLVPLGLVTTAFTILFVTVPNRHVPRWHAFAGGVVAGLAFEGMKAFFGLYISNVSTYKAIYGTFASFPIFLIWLYLSWLAVMVGAVIASSLSYWSGQAWRQHTYAGRQFYHALKLLNMLYLSAKTGHVSTLASLRSRVHLGLDELEDILEQLAKVNWVQRVSGKRGWVLARDVGEITVFDVFQVFVLDLDAVALSTESENGAIDHEMKRLHDHLEGDFHRSLEALFSAPKTANAAIPG